MIRLLNIAKRQAADSRPYSFSVPLAGGFSTRGNKESHLRAVQVAFQMYQLIYQPW